MGRDDNGYWRVVIEDKLRDGEGEDLLCQVRVTVAHESNHLLHTMPCYGPSSKSQI